MDKVYSHDSRLMCSWHQWRVTAVGRLELEIKAGHCTDMTGAIRVGRRLMPDVQEIIVVSGGVPDIVYRRDGELWQGICQRMTRAPGRPFVVQEEEAMSEKGGGG